MNQLLGRIAGDCLVCPTSMINMLRKIENNSVFVAKHPWIFIIHYSDWHQFIIKDARKLIGGYELLTSEFATWTRKTMRVCLLTCWLNVNATGRSFHEARGHVLVLILFRESRVLVTHQPVLKKENDFILKCRFVLQRVLFRYPVSTTGLPTQ